MTPTSPYIATAARAAFITLTLLAGARSAAAEPIVLEAYGGAPPDDADRLLAPVMAELARAGFPAPAQVSRRIEAELSRDGSALSDEDAAAALRRIDEGYRKYLGGRFDDAIADIDAGVVRLLGAPAALVGQESRREELMRGLVGLAMSQRRLGRQTEAAAAMAELLRSFPDVEISNKEYGPEPRDFHRQVLADLAREGRGSLTVEVDDDRSAVFVNERYAGGGDVTVRDLLPGTYRVFVQQGDQAGRVHQVVVEAGATAVTSVTWSLDAVLRSRGRTLLVFADEAARRDEEGRQAVRVARALRAPSVVVLGVRQNRGRRSVVGAVYAAESTRPLRSGAVAVEPVAPTAARLEALGRLLAGDEAAASMVATLADGEGEADEVDTGEAPRPFRVWKWVTVATGLAAVAAGITLVAIHDPASLDDMSRDEASRETRTAGIITASAGVAVTALGVYFFWRDRKDAKAATISVAPSHDGAVFVWTGSF